MFPFYVFVINHQMSPTMRNFSAFQYIIANFFNHMRNVHYILTPEAKMRNHLAEDILNSDMLHLMELYQKNLGNEGAFLNQFIGT
jgi:hypothetical protein